MIPRENLNVSMLNRIKSSFALFFHKYINVPKLVSFNLLALVTLVNIGIYLRNRSFLFVGQASTIEEFLEEFANSDRATMLTLAMNLGRQSQSEYSWILNLWPPGSASLNYILLKFTSSIYLIQWFWGVLIFSLWMLVAHKAIQISAVNRKSATIAILLLIFNNPIFQFKFYTSTMLMSDSIATPLGIGALLFLYNGLTKKSSKDILWFGILISCAAHFRAIWMKEIEFLIISGILIFVIQQVRGQSKKFNKKSISSMEKLGYGMATHRMFSHQFI